MIPKHEDAMNDQVEIEAEKLCRDVGIATMLPRVMPGLGALTGLVVMPLVEPEAGVDWGPALGFLAAAVALFLLGRALRQRRPWSFPVAQVLFTGVAVVGVIALVMNEEADKVAVLFVVALPMGFVGGATKAKRAVDTVNRVREAQRRVM